MALNLQKKQVIVSEVAEQAKSAVSAVVADYRGLTVSEITVLRVEARKTGVYLRVVRNTLARRAVEGTPFSCLQEVLKGPSILAFSEKEPGASARLVRGFAKEHEKLVVKAISLDGQLMAADMIDKVADLPTRDQALSQLMSVMQAPLVQLLRTMREPTAKMVRLFDAVRDKKGSAEN